ncbi:MAG: T9SS type A sorting domain-containing protein, partial [Chitinophagales bacterium]
LPANFTTNGAAVDDEGNLYVSDFENQYIRKISADGMVTTVAGNGIAGYVDGLAATAEFNYPRGIVVDASGNLYVSDSWNHRIRKIDVSGEVSTYAGGGNIFGVQSVSEFKDGNDTTARFYTPCGLSMDEAGNIYVADAYNHRVRKIDPARVVTTVAGTGLSGSTGGGFQDGDTSVARFNTLTELFVTSSSVIYVSDTYNNRIRLVENGVVSTVAGSGVAGYLDGLDTVAKFNHTRGVILDSTGNHLYVCDGNNRRIRKVTFDISVGIETATIPNDFSVFPNPSSGVFFVGGLFSGQKILVTDMMGRTVYKGIFAEGNRKIDIGLYSAGMYLIKVDGGKRSGKIWKVYKME